MEETIKNLQEYVENDMVYEKWKLGELKGVGDFEDFCIKHCQDIENIIEDYVKKDEELQELKQKPDYEGYIADKRYEEKRINEG